jgi:hypothetical protein
MACPFFMPTERLQQGTWMHPSRLPLGAGWKGRCCAPGCETADVPLNVLESFCNMGYAAACPSLPKERQYDSIRFAVAHDGNPRIVLWYSCERDHLPAAHGKLEYDATLQAWISTHADFRIQKMADCYLQSYLLRRIQPASADFNASLHS